MKVIELHIAGGTIVPIEPAIIIINKPLGELGTRKNSYHEDADQLVQILRSTIPGAVYDLLIVKLLTTKVSELTTPYSEVNKDD